MIRRLLASFLFTLLAAFAAFAAFAACAPAWAAAADVAGHWQDEQAPEGVPRLGALPVTGGRFVFEGVLTLAAPGRHVLDFRNGHVLGRFTHTLSDATGNVVWQAEGGLQSAAVNPFVLRHGRELDLPSGTYRLRTQLTSPYFIAPPAPYVDDIDHYRRAIAPGNALAFTGIGVFIGLGFYYACLALSRRRATEALYAAFILGNLLFNLSSLGIAHDLLGIRWFHLSSVPILLSNMAYVGFVMALLDLKRHAPRLALAGRCTLAVLVMLAAVAAAQPSLAMEACRWGVGLFLAFGLVAGVCRSWSGDPLARRYLVANLGFAVAGFIAITTADLGSLHTLTIEHIGLVAVTIEVLLLALVLAYQFGQLQRDTRSALHQAEANLKLALTDSLTGLPNRHALERSLTALPDEGSLTFIDLDGLKRFNDRYGHAEGDRLLRDFGVTLQHRLEPTAVLHRLAGDEFVALSMASVSSDHVRQALDDTVRTLRGAGHDLLGASFGHVARREAGDVDTLQRMADQRMYAHKRRRQADAPCEDHSQPARRNRQ